MTFKYGAIPTEYKGIRFRSRTEARWAAFFDAMGWKWEYEPYDLAGWIPDFALKLRSGERLVEVKPASSFPELANYATSKQLSQAPEGTILLGSAPMMYGPQIDAPDWHPHMRIGLNFQRTPLKVHGDELAKGLRDSIAKYFLERTNYDFDVLPTLVAPVLVAAGISIELNAPEASEVIGPCLCACGSTYSIDLSDCECESHHPTDWTVDGVIRDAWAKAQNATQWKGGRS